MMQDKISRIFTLVGSLIQIVPHFAIGGWLTLGECGVIVESNAHEGQ